MLNFFRWWGTCSSTVVRSGRFKRSSKPDRYESAVGRSVVCVFNPCFGNFFCTNGIRYLCGGFITLFSLTQKKRLSQRALLCFNDIIIFCFTASWSWSKWPFSQRFARIHAKPVWGEWNYLLSSSWRRSKFLFMLRPAYYLWFISLTFLQSLVMWYLPCLECHLFLPVTDLLHLSNDTFVIFIFLMHYKNICSDCGLPHLCQSSLSSVLWVWPRFILLSVLWIWPWCILLCFEVHGLRSFLNNIKLFLSFMLIGWGIWIQAFFYFLFILVNLSPLWLSPALKGWE